ncbi:hypothetical protein [Pseudoalteromonas sp. SWN166]|uniref:hypothetical protein n=1 Tax=Pseudoalteromonas sp. SWN166 TaxID=2792061 RepID=UPI0018CD1A9B|nr:hypothetical protein [Pseudoalteromonas sp. SWN166]MBH0038561.1 hypothetical protein [Pseudoalteromonas sp. SWN166]
MKLLGFFIVFLIFTISYLISTNWYEFYTALGALLGGISATIALIYSYSQYSRLNGLDERASLSCVLLPKVSLEYGRVLGNSISGYLYTISTLNREYSERNIHVKINKKHNLRVRDLNAILEISTEFERTYQVLIFKQPKLKLKCAHEYEELLRIKKYAIYLTQVLVQISSNKNELQQKEILNSLIYRKSLNPEDEILRQVLREEFTDKEKAYDFKNQIKHICDALAKKISL